MIYNRVISDPSVIAPLSRKYNLKKKKIVKLHKIFASYIKFWTDQLKKILKL